MPQSVAGRCGGAAIRRAGCRTTGVQQRAAGGGELLSSQRRSSPPKGAAALQLSTRAALARSRESPLRTANSVRNEALEGCEVAGLFSRLLDGRPTILRPGTLRSSQTPAPVNRFSLYIHATILPAVLAACSPSSVASWPSHVLSSICSPTLPFAPFVCSATTVPAFRNPLFVALTLLHRISYIHPGLFIGTRTRPRPTPGCSPSHLPYISLRPAPSVFDGYLQHHAEAHATTNTDGLHQHRELKTISISPDGPHSDSTTLEIPSGRKGNILLRSQGQKKQTVAIHSSTLYTTVTAATRLSALSTPPNHPTFLHYRSISPTPTGLSYCEETVHATHPAHSGYCIFRTVAGWMSHRLLTLPTPDIDMKRLGAAAPTAGKLQKNPTAPTRKSASFFRMGTSSSVVTVWLVLVAALLLVSGSEATVIKKRVISEKDIVRRADNPADVCARWSHQCKIISAGSPGFR